MREGCWWIRCHPMYDRHLRSHRSVQSLFRPSSRPRAISQKGSSYLQKMTGFCSKIRRDLLEVPCLPLTPQALSNLLEHMARGRAAWPATWTCCRTVSCSGPHSMAAAWVTWKTDWSPTPKRGICYLQNLKRPTRHCASFLVVGGARCNNLEGISWHAPHHWISRSFTEVIEGLLSFC